MRGYAKGVPLLPVPAVLPTGHWGSERGELPEIRSDTAAAAAGSGEVV